MICMESLCSCLFFILLTDPELICTMQCCEGHEASMGCMIRTDFALHTPASWTLW